MTPDEWPFEDPVDVAVVTTSFIVEKTAWIQYVSHDADDGGWQFHGPGDFPGMEHARLVALGEIVELDPSVTALATMPLGWHATRDTPDGEWRPSPMPPEEDVT